MIEVVMNQEDLKKRRDELTTKIFWLGLHISFIFAIPAVIGVIAGKYLDEFFNTGNKITTFVLLFTFIFSWILVFIKYNQLNKKLKGISQKIKESKKN